MDAPEPRARPETHEIEGPLEEPDLNGEVTVVRLRLALIVAATALIAILTGAVLAAVIAPDPEGRLGIAIRGAPLPWLASVVLAFAGACTLTTLLARRVVEPARKLDSARRHYGALYAQAQSRALEDSLTRLGNHRAFQEELDRQLDIDRRHGVPVALMLLDLDDFKLINDSAGHAVGDAVLLEMSRLLRSGLRQADRPFRVGGDEFAVLMPHTTIEEADVVARRLLGSAVAQRPGSAFPRGFSFSAGVTGAPELGTTRAELFEQADEALYAAKRQGRTIVKVFDPERSTRTLDGPTLAKAAEAVAAVVESRSLRAVYQPIVDLASGRVVGYEGLVRPTQGSGFEIPATLFAAAELAGRTSELDRVCIETVLAGAGALAYNQSLSLNVSLQTIVAPEFSPAWLARVLAESGLAPSRIVLEVAERESLRDVDLVRRRLAALQAIGVRIAIDDVGAGNEGFRLLSQIHFDVVKIDLLLIGKSERDTSVDALRPLTELAARWGAMPVAESVETPSQLRVVCDLGLSEAQGYLLGRPMPTPQLRSIDIDRLLREPDLRIILGTASPQAERRLPRLTEQSRAGGA